MEQRSKRLGSLLKVQKRLQAVHEARHAGHLAAAMEAASDVDDLRARSDSHDSFSSVFPDLYSRHIAEALERAEAARIRAAEEASHVATASLRAQRVEEAWRKSRSEEERQVEEREILEGIELRHGNAQ